MSTARFFPASSFLSLLLTATFLTAAFADDDADSKKPATDANDGPFVSSSAKAVQRFDSAILLPTEKISKPLTLTFTNGGIGGRYAWLRVFLNPGYKKGATPRQQITGKMILNENSFRSSNSVTIDLTGLLAAGSNLLEIQGAGAKGAECSWELKARESKGSAGKGGASNSGKLSITNVDPAEVPSGGVITVSGTGFDEKGANMTATIYNRQAKIVKASATSVDVQVPDGLSPFSYDVEVAYKGATSNKLKFRVLGAPEVTSSTFSGMVPGHQVEISGKNFSTQAGKNVVTFEALDARHNGTVIKATSDTLTVTVPEFPELADRLNSAINTPGTVSVSVNGAKCQNPLSIYISIREMVR